MDNWAGWGERTVDTLSEGNFIRLGVVLARHSCSDAVDGEISCLHICFSRKYNILYVS